MNRYFFYLLLNLLETAKRHLKKKRQKTKINEKSENRYFFKFLANYSKFLLYLALLPIFYTHLLEKEILKKIGKNSNTKFHILPQNKNWQNRCFTDSRVIY